MNKEILELARALGGHLSNLDLTMVTAESCTGGMIASAITEIEGASAWFEQGFVTYSNGSKKQLLGVPAKLLECDGAASESVVRAMLEGGLERTGAELGVAVSGIAGPGGGTEEKPVGTVWVAWGSRNSISTKKYNFKGNRAEVRLGAVAQSLTNLILTVEKLIPR